MAGVLCTLYRADLVSRILQCELSTVLTKYLKLFLSHHISHTLVYCNALLNPLLFGPKVAA